MVTLPSKPTLLIVEDEPGPRNSLRQILQPQFQIYEAGNGRDALITLRSHPIDLVTLDQKLPDVQGIDLLKNIKEERTHVEVIIITGYGSLQSAMEGMRFGIAGYLLKPFNVNELVMLINQTLDKKTRLDLLRSNIQQSKNLWKDDTSLEETWKDMKEQYALMVQDKPSDQLPLSDSFELTPFLSDLLEAYSRDLFHHSSRVSFYSTLLGNSLNFTEEKQDALALGGLIHDIGYIGETKQWEMFPGEHPHSEQEIIPHHTETGARITAPLGLSAEVKQIISFHHEWFDGSRSLHGLLGSGIPYEAQIVGIANMFDHFRMEGPEKPALSLDEALQKLQSLSGTRFNPSLISHFMNVVKSGSPTK